MSNDEVRIPQVGEIWQHWKGDVYEIVSVASAERDGSIQVVYRGQNGLEWVRPLWEWVQNVTLKGGRQVQRYTLVRNPDSQTNHVPFLNDNPAPPKAVPLTIDGMEVQA